MSSVLKQKTIWVTRPSHQAEILCQLLADKEAEPVRFPVMEITPIIGDDSLSERFDLLSAYHYIIFISRNAVDIAFSHYLTDHQLAETRYIAIGKATADKLREYGISEIIDAGASADSEALLSIEALQTKSITNQSILLVRGSGGRELLPDELRVRGAKVDVVEIYSRNIPHYTEQECVKFWQDHPPDAIIVTSNETLQNLLDLTPESNRSQLYHTDLITMSERIAGFAKRSGFVGRIMASEEKSDSGLLRTLESLFGDKQ